jgi:hypothetical protein
MSTFTKENSTPRDVFRHAEIVLVDGMCWSAGSYKLAYLFAKYLTVIALVGKLPELGPKIYNYLGIQDVENTILGCLCLAVIFCMTMVYQYLQFKNYEKGWHDWFDQYGHLKWVTDWNDPHVNWDEE